ncbi:LacI family transcriptional regulator [Microbacterium sp. zg.Y625]|uniref:LacI family DNA-binding transcriptional regulator n=1 Tax=Microbacterium jiangjiandongii TaxID=3049071 RepID=UPI00214ABF18|nr:MULTISPECIES: LacI family DNA-binding transcriptional regulator [unclassified Microbacterium]MCR2792748.1 LacI family transcriptional regulator [Microbacterium sp. zg.Y625]WIM26726.1 LacI family DNA-binding transcriptional regulator [Microbacterium sp. zg-Y625]
MTTSPGLPRPATSADVARHAGVSRSTVSNILNGNDARFSDETRRRVHEAARELDYRPSVAGRSLVSGRSDTIVVLVANSSFAAHFQDAVDRVMKSTRQIGGNVVIRMAGETPQATSDAVAVLRPLAVVDFGVLSPDERASLEARGTIIVPSLPVTHESDDLDGGIAALQASALLEHHPAALWFAGLTRQERDPYVPSRYAALAKVCEREALPRPGRIDLELTVESGVSVLRRVLDGPMPAGIACYNDEVALTLVAAARELGVEVPSAIAVVGVDNSPLGRMWSPPLTTIDTDLLGMVDAITVELRIRLGEEGLEMPRSHNNFSLVRGGTA